MTGRLRLALAVGLAIALTRPASAEDVPAAPDEPGPITLQIVPLPGPPVEFYLGGAPLNLRHLKIGLADGRWMRLVECGTELCAQAAQRGPMTPRLPEDGVPGTRMTKGSHPFVEVWLADAVERAGTGVLPGSTAGTLAARDRAGRVHRLVLPLDRAIEDYVPRLADLDANGRDEIVMALTREAEGAALAIVTLRQDGLVIAAESEPERSGVWRDPIAIAQLDGEGPLEIATVTAGDGIGRLEVWRLAEGVLGRVMSMKGFRTQIEGTRRAGMAAVADMDGDGIADLIVPAADRRSCV